MKQIISENGISSSTLREIVLLGQLGRKDSSNIVEIKDVEVSDAERESSLAPRKRYSGLVFDCADTDLHKYIKDFNNKLSIEKIQSFNFQILQGLYNIHSFNIIHRDLKPQNILIKNGILKIADFGLACSVSPCRERLTPDMVSLRYRCPELLFGETSYSYEVDIWSVGCILAEMITRTPLFKGRTVIGQLEHIFQILGTPNDSIWPQLSETLNSTNIPKYHGKDLKSILNLDDISAHFLRETLQCNPRSRPNVSTLLYHKFVRTSPQKPKSYNIISDQSLTTNHEISSHTNENIDVLQQIKCKLYDGIKVKVSHSNNNMYNHSSYQNDRTENCDHINSLQVCQNIPMRKSIYDSMPNGFNSDISDIPTTNRSIPPCHQPSEDILNLPLKPIIFTPENKSLLPTDNDAEYHPKFSQCAMDVIDSIDTTVDIKTSSHFGLKRNLSASNFENLPNKVLKVR